MKGHLKFNYSSTSPSYECSGIASFSGVSLLQAADAVSSYISLDVSPYAISDATIETITDSQASREISNYSETVPIGDSLLLFVTKSD